MHQFKLIDSSYTVSEAREILLAIINSKIQKEMQYPGQIKVTVIRELRSVNVAR